MAKNLQKMHKVFPEQYDFFPRTFVLPTDMNEFMTDGGKEEKIQKMLSETDANMVAQHYMHKPHLVHGYKYDMRIYTVVLSCDPLRVFIYKEGLARICTEKYQAPKASNIGVSFMHLTNYALNKHNNNFIANEGGGNIDEASSKWSFEQLAGYINSSGNDWDKVWSDIHESLPRTDDGFSCFELLGYDVMLDSDLRPWLIEVNHSASFQTDSPLDLEIKTQLIYDTLSLVRIDPKLIQRARKMEKMSLAARILGLPKKPPATAASATGGPASSQTPATPSATSAASTADKEGESNADKEASTIKIGLLQTVTGDKEASTLKSGLLQVDSGSWDTKEASIIKSGLLQGLPYDFKPKTAEEYEAWRADILLKRDKLKCRPSRKKGSGSARIVEPTIAQYS
eukprot:gene19090-25691_t